MDPDIISSGGGGFAMRVKIASGGGIHFGGKILSRDYEAGQLGSGRLWHIASSHTIYSFNRDNKLASQKNIAGLVGVFASGPVYGVGFVYGVISSCSAFSAIKTWIVCCSYYKLQSSAFCQFLLLVISGACCISCFGFTSPFLIHLAVG